MWLFAGTALLDASEQVIHASAQFGGHIGLEMQLRDAKKLQADGELVAQEWARMIQGGERLLNVRSVGHSDPDQRVPLIGCDLDAGDDGRANAGIGKFVADELGQFFAKRFGNPLGTMCHANLFNPLHA